MKYFLLSLCMTFCFSTSYSQKSQTKAGPVFKDFGEVYVVKNADLLLDTDKKHKVIFDVYTDEKKSGKINPLINTVARFMNMHGQNGVLQENMDLVIVLHGAATKNALSDKAFKKDFKAKNPNSDLLEALHEKKVQIYVCGQSLLSKGYDANDLSKNVQVSLSALTALVKYQADGYQLITFN